MNNIKSEIVYLRDELIVRKAFVKDGEDYDIVVKYSGIQRLQQAAPADLAERIKGIWQQANVVWKTTDLTTEFTWDRNRVLVGGKEVSVGKDNPMKQLHELIVGRFYQGITPVSVAASAQTSAPATTSIHVQPLSSPKPRTSRKRSSSTSTSPTMTDSPPSISQLISPKKRAEPVPEEPVISDSVRDVPISRPCTERRPEPTPQVMGPTAGLPDWVAERVFQRVRANEKIGDLDTLIGPLKKLKQSRNHKNNQAVRFLNSLTAEIDKTLPRSRAHLCKSFAVNIFCKNVKVSDAGFSARELLLVYQQVTR
jgi:hypothetical protein